jgi:hypothetical protein
MRIRQGAWAWVVAGVVSLAAAGCTGGENGAATPSATQTSPAPSPSLSDATSATAPTAPAPSPVMSQASADGATAAAKYFIELYMYAAATGDLEAWRAMSADDCKMCNKVIAEVEQLVVEHHAVSTASLEFPSASGTEIAPGTSYSASLRVVQGPWTEVDSAGRTVDTGPAASADMYFALLWQGSSGLVRQVDVHEANPQQ